MKTSLRKRNKLHPPNFNPVVSSPKSSLKEHFTVKSNVYASASLYNNVINQHSGKHVTTVYWIQILNLILTSLSVLRF